MAVVAVTANIHRLQIRTGTSTQTVLPTLAQVQQALLMEIVATSKSLTPQVGLVLVLRPSIQQLQIISAALFWEILVIPAHPNQPMVMETILTCQPVWLREPRQLPNLPVILVQERTQQLFGLTLTTMALLIHPKKLAPKII